MNYSYFVHSTQLYLISCGSIQNTERNLYYKKAYDILYNMKHTENGSAI